MNLTAQQSAFVSTLLNTSSNVALVARAGCGKTSTILAATVELVKKFPRCEIAIVCYGNTIAKEIGEKVAKLGLDWKQVNTSTTHSLGMGLCKFAFRLEPKRDINANKVRDIITRLREEGDEACDYYGAQIGKLVSLAKGDGFGFFGDKQIGDRSAWYALADHYDVNGFDDTTDMDAVIDAAQKVYRISLNDTKTIDFDDMVLFPLIKNLSVKFPKDIIFVDEAQDTSPARQALIRKFLKPRTGRIVLVGDDRQAIMGFSGADVDALPNMIRDFSAVALPLSMTWRCPKAVVREAQRLVPDIEAAESAIEGSVVRMAGVPEDLKAGDAVLCRNTAPLIVMAYSLIRKGIACKVEGRAIGEGLSNLAKRWKVKSVDVLLQRLETYREREISKAMAKGNDAKVEEVEDRVATLVEICNACIAQNKTTVQDVLAFIDNLFADGATNVVVMATYHRSKGREWERVILFQNSARCPSKAAKQPWQLQQEYNLEYVAITRAQRELIYAE